MKIYYGNGEVGFVGVNDIAAFEIRYTGVIQASSELPDSIVLACNERKIMGFNMGTISPTSLFSYIGELRITSCGVTDRNFEGKIVTPISMGVNDWGKATTKFEDFTQFPEDYGAKDSRGGGQGGGQGKTLFIHRNLTTNQGEWFYEDGMPYYGEYHIHVSENYQAMTGSIHNKDSKNIYRKDARGNLFMLNGGKPSRTTPTITPRITPSGGGY
jgi:hypothetical protein